MQGRTSGPHRERAAETNPSRVIVFALFLIAGTLAIYSPVRNNGFINYDDFDYVVKNPHVTAGLTWHAVQWSFTSIELANWHPLTWLSHALDCQLFGLDAGDHHITSLVIHIFDVLLLFFLLQRVTGAVGRSFVVAALFAWHPFNVESVAWVAERKNVLSTFFFLLALGAYGWYALRPSFRRMLVVAAVFILALASKPMAVSLPFVLLLLDYWPLQRVAGWTNSSPRFPAPQRTAGQLLLEKWPLFALSVASSVVTVWAQRAGGAMRSLQSFSFGTRLGNALYSYAVYVGKTLWPGGFAVYYPHPTTALPFWKPVLAAVILCAISIAVWSRRFVRPYLLIGWLWFLGTLVPVIGIVQVGDQAMANRYAYLPLMGLFVMAVWGAGDFFDAVRLDSRPRVALALVALGTFAFLSFRETSYWQDSGTIWTRALQVIPGNLHIEKQLANAFALQGNSEEAMPHLINIAALDPGDAATHANLGSCYAMRGQTNDAIREFEAAIKLTDHGNLIPEDRVSRSSAQLNLGFVYASANDYAKALANLLGANQTNPAMIDSTMETVGRGLAYSPSEIGFIRLALLLRVKGNENDASSILEKAIQANPGYAGCRALLSFFGAEVSASSKGGA